MSLVRRSGAVALLKPNRKNRDIGRSDATDTCGLAEGLWTNFAEALLRFALQACKRPVISIMGQWTGFLAGHAVDLLALAEDVPFVFEVGFNEGPEFHGEPLLERGRKILPTIVLTSEPVIEFETVVGGFAHETGGLAEDFEFRLRLLVALVTG